MEVAIGSTLVPRQIWINPTTATNSLPPTCTPFVLPSGGLINIGQNTVLTLTQDAAFQPACSGTSVPQPLDPTQPGVESVLNYQDPFYSSTNPQIYAIAAATIVSYMLVIILFITPRTFFVGGAGGGGGFLGQGGMVSGAYGSNSIIGVGSRPWLQKAATLAVAISLTIVTADTLRWAEMQYNAGYDDATELTVEVLDGLEIRIVRVISETFLWLAQAQTLIRLFPRHKEKLVIKWTAFGLITLELVFSSLNQFVDQDGRSQTKNFVNAVPALDYLFALALNLCYAAFVIYYSMVKRRFAFWNEKMRNMPLVALLSLTAVLIPVIFFILDLSQPNVSGWGNYVRWVGAAAASVIVWEWVERIEALERDEKKDGILGREVFDGDEMLENTPSSELGFRRIRREKDATQGSGRDGGFGRSMSTGWNNLASGAIRLHGPLDWRSRQQGTLAKSETKSSQAVDRRDMRTKAKQQQLQREQEQDHQHPFPQRPAPLASPVSRADTASAGSTVYAVHYHPVTEPTRPILQRPSDARGVMSQPPVGSTDLERSPSGSSSTPGHGILSSSTALTHGISRILNPFRRQRTSPPLEVAQAMSCHPSGDTAAATPTRNKESLLTRLHLRAAPREDTSSRPIIVVPAPQRRRPSTVTEASDSEELTRQADDVQRYSISQNPSSEDRDSPPDAVLRAINSPQPSEQGLDHTSESLRWSTPAETRPARRGTLLFLDTRRPEDNHRSTSPPAPEDLMAADRPEVEESTAERRPSEQTREDV